MSIHTTFLLLSLTPMTLFYKTILHFIPVSGPTTKIEHKSEGAIMTFLFSVRTPLLFIKIGRVYSSVCDSISRKVNKECQVELRTMVPWSGRKSD